jgi:hypothetical protein
MTLRCGVVASSYAHAYREVLADAQRSALENASVVYVDECFHALEAAKPGELLTDTAIDLHLPDRYAHHYGQGFGRRWTVTVVTVGWKLGQPRRVRLSCVAEELALNALVEHAKFHLELHGIPDSERGWDDFYEWAFEDEDWRYLFDRSMDGIEDDPDIQQKFALVNLEFPKWFEPFAASYPRPHPFALGNE